MTDKGEKLEFKLAKLMIAAAWADGNVSTSEINAVKDLILTERGFCV